MAMEHDILCIGPMAIQPEAIRESLDGEAFGEFHIRPASSVEEAEACLFENRVCLVIADSRVSGLFEWLSAMKNDEMFRHVPVLGVVADGDPEKIRSAFSLGLDNVVAETAAGALLPVLAKPLVRSFLSNEDMMHKLSDMHEAAIHDFILVDLIKDYIPRTIWDIAKAYAHLQKIAIPEEETELTVVFADIQDFSEMAQHMPPREVIRTLNTVYEIATRIVYKGGGDIDKFIGDAFLAVFHDPKIAVESMVSLQREMGEMNAGRAAEKMRPILLRIGIHTGPVIRGNVGGNNRYDNTLIGDTVNMASRLEGIAPAGGIIVSEESLKKAGFSVPPAHMRRERLRGRDVEDTVYEVFEYFRSAALIK
jgi:adenylate cyclase